MSEEPRMKLRGFRDQDGLIETRKPRRASQGIRRGRESQMKRTLIRIAISLGPIVAVILAGIDFWKVGGGTVGLPVA
jgi:hypothetical protein